MVGTKAFLVSVAMMPILMFGSMAAMSMLKNVTKIEEKTIAVIDHTGQLLPVLQAAATANNAMLDALIKKSEPPKPSAKDNPDSQGKSETAAASKRAQEDDFGPSLSRGTKYILEVVDPVTVTDDTRVELSDRIARKELYAFVEIPSDILNPPSMPPMSALLEAASGSSDSAAALPAPPEIRFHSMDSTLAEARMWIDRILNETIKAKRLELAGIDPLVVMTASQHVPARGKGLVLRNAAGVVQPVEEKDEMTAIFLPLIAMMLMFMVIFMAAQPMLESVLEEKSQRIAEVLLGSTNPTQLMAGKLLGTVGGSLTIFAIYMAGGFFAAQRTGWLENVPYQLLPWFVAFQILGVMLYAAIFMAVGAAVSQLKEAQSMLLPVWMVMMIPMFIWFYIVREPDSSLAVWLSLFPPITPSMMILRMATGTVVPIWQPLLGLVLLVITTIFVVILSGRIFRVGILWQGKSPKLGEIFRWAIGL